MSDEDDLDFFTKGRSGSLYLREDDLDDSESSSGEEEVQALVSKSKRWSPKRKKSSKKRSRHDDKDKKDAKKRKKKQSLTDSAVLKDLDVAIISDDSDIELDEKQQEENAKQEAELEKTLSKVAQLRHRAMIDELELSRSAEGFESESPVSMRQPPKKSTLKICLRRAGQKDYGITIGHNFTIRSIFDVYNAIEGLDEEDVQILLDKVEVNWEDTVAKLGLSDGDSLEIRVQGDQKLYDFEDEADNRIVLKLSGKWGSELLRVDKSKPFRALLEAYCQKQKVDSKGIHLQFDGDAVDLDMAIQDHPEELEDEEQLDVLVQN